MSERPPTYTTCRLRPDVRRVLEGLRAGQRLRITQTVRVGIQQWPAVVVGTFRFVDSLATGLATDRVPQDDIVVPIVHFTKDNGELSSVALDENSVIEVTDAPPTPPPPTDGPVKQPATPPAAQG